MNFIQSSVRFARDRGCTPAEALVFSLVLLRGGMAQDQLVLADFAEWHTRHSNPTWDRLEAWAAELDIESAIAEPACRLRAGEVE